MHQKNKHNKHIAKLKYLKIGEMPKNQYIEDDHIDVQVPDRNYPPLEESTDNVVAVDKQTQNTSNTVSFEPNSFFNKNNQDVQLKTSGNQADNSDNSSPMPSFLQKVFGSKDETVSTSAAVESPKDLKMLPFSGAKTEVNPNSFSSIFNQDHQEIFGIQRVFKKSILFLILHLLSFGLLTFTSLNLFTLPLLWTVIVGIAYIVITNIFYIIVADRSYVWLSLTGQVVLLLITHAFVGLSFDKVTLVFALLITLFTYFAYGELEKVQLSSRLFSIAHITSESIRILLTVLILILSLGVFNKALSEGSENFVSEAFLSKPLILNNIVIGRYKNLSLNRYLMQGKFYVENNTVKSDSIRPATGTQSLTFADFLASNYRSSKDGTVVTEERSAQILGGCDKKTVKNCNTLVQKEKQDNLEVWRKEAYGNLPYTLETELTPLRFNEISKQYYVNEVKKLSSDSSANAADKTDITDTLSKYVLVPRSYIFPAFIALLLFLALTLIKFLLRIFVFWATWISWKILVLTGFAKIEIEKVEAEIVSI